MGYFCGLTINCIISSVRSPYRCERERELEPGGQTTTDSCSHQPDLVLQETGNPTTRTGAATQPVRNTSVYLLRPAIEIQHRGHHSMNTILRILQFHPSIFRCFYMYPLAINHLNMQLQTVDLYRHRTCPYLASVLCERER